MPKETLTKYHKTKDVWIEFENPKLKEGDVIKIIDESNLSNYLKFEVVYIGESRVNVKLIEKR